MNMDLYETMTSIGSTELLVAGVILMASFFFFFTMFYNKDRKRLPPGPKGLPIVGYLPFLRKEPHIKLQKLASTYGDVFSLNLGSQLVVVLNGADAVKEGMNKTEFLGRPPQGAFSLNPDIPSIVSISGNDFQEQRKFMLSCMRDLGFGKSILEQCMKDEIEYFLRVLQDWNGQPHEVTTALAPSTSNNITALIYGTRYDYEDSRRKFLDNKRKIITQFFGQTAIHIFFPWIKKLPFVNAYLGYDAALEAFDALLRFNRAQIEEHRKTLDPNNTRDYFDKFLLEIENIKESKRKKTSFSENMLIGNTTGLLGAGSETVQVTVDWSLYIMAVYPDVQKKVLQEISSIVGFERTPSYADHKHMPYTQAVIMEILRWKTISPLNLLRFTFEDTSFRSYHIPKETIILANFWSAHYDIKYWDQPEVFKPERFLSQDGKKVIKSEAYMPFSVGKRSCPGESMASIEVFLYFTAILQRFVVSLPEGVVPDLDGILTISYAAKPHKLSFVPRSPN